MMLRSLFGCIVKLYRDQSGISERIQQGQSQYALLRQQSELLALQLYEGVKKTDRFNCERRLLRFGYKVYAQTDEDGIISEIFRRIGTTNKTFVEFGVGNGLENNSLALLINGWSGLWIDGGNEQEIKSHFSTLLNNRQLRFSRSFITANNINSIISGSSISGEVDFLSIDIDGNDYHIFEAIEVIQPRVVAIEYNAKFRPPIRWCMAYNENHLWDRSDYFGASLESLCGLFEERDYSLVGCSVSGINAFFVKNHLVQDSFLSPFTAENHYEPARYWLSRFLSSGHHPNFGPFKST